MSLHLLQDDVLRKSVHMSNIGLMTANPNAGIIPALNTLPNRLRVAREHAGLTKSELSDKAGVNRNTIANAEAGASVPSRATVTVWAFACGVDVEWLRNGYEKAPSPDGDGAAVRHEGFEPPTFWLGAEAGTVTRLPRRQTEAA